MINYNDNRAENVKIAYIGGGSRGWAWGLMSDLAKCDKMSGQVRLYDIDEPAAENNALIGNTLNALDGCISKWNYKVFPTLESALSGADFVVISILPGTFDEMESDVHAPEAYGIYQSVGDTTGPGGLVRALRTVPMFEVIAAAVRDHCPDAWVINYTNPMAVCVDTLYRVFPGIKAFGCCHEVFGTQKFLQSVLEEEAGIVSEKRQDIKTNVVGINHFTWLTSASFQNVDLFPLYRSFVEKYGEEGYQKGKDENWMNNSFDSSQKVKMYLFRRFCLIAAAGDRHLAEFCPGQWFLNDPETVRSWGFGLTTVDWRRKDLEDRLARSRRLAEGSEAFVFHETGEEGVAQMCALLGLGDLHTNVNLPNRGQIPNLPLQAVVETNAFFTSDRVTPDFAGPVPDQIYPLVSRVCGVQRLTAKAAFNRDLSLAFEAFLSDPLVRVSPADARKLFLSMLKNTANYLGDYRLPDESAFF